MGPVWPWLTKDAAQPTKGDGLLDKLSQAATTYDAGFVRAHGPALMQEWGTLVTGGNRQQDGYLRGILDTSWRSGANGFREYSNGCPDGSIFLHGR